ncbi:MAG: hypothetical protein LBU65_06210 [Planctomycetaceae bacterium]|jgi:signal transduction histidine kinase|nr:hypothetical protein [Planctomycetaceae bacterium]
MFLLKLFFSDVTIGIVLFVSVSVLGFVTFRNRHRTYRKILFVAWALFLAICTSCCFFIHWSDRQVVRGLGNLIENITYHISTVIADNYALLPVDDNTSAPRYQAGMDLLREYQRLLPIIGSIYTFRVSSAEAANAELVLSPAFDMNRDNKIDGLNEIDDLPGTLVAMDDDIRIAIREKKLSVSKSPVTDRWGTWVSAIQPIFNNNDDIESLVGVDFWASDWYQSIYTGRICPCTVFYTCLLYFFSRLSFFITRKRDEKNLRLYMKEMFSTVESTRQHIVRVESSDSNKQEFMQNMLEMLSAHFAVISHNIVVIREQNLLEYKNAVGGYVKALQAINRKSAKILAMLDSVHTYINVSMEHPESGLRGVSLRDAFSVVDNSVAGWICRKSGINFTINIDKDAPDEIIVDDASCMKILLTLLDNSFQFTERGKITVDMTIQRSDALSQIGLSSSEKWLRDFQSIISFNYDDFVNPFFERLSYLVISITDTGRGIRPEKIPTLFQPYFDTRKSSMSPTSRFTLPENSDIEEGAEWDSGSASLKFNLCTAQTLARSIGGMIRVVSTPNVGSTFTLFVPVALLSPARTNTHTHSQTEQHKEEPQKSSPEYALGGLRLLVVDDNVPHRSYVENTLCQFGAMVEPIDSDTAAIELLLAERNQGRFFDAVIINSRLGNSGENLMTRIRNLGFCRGIILLGSASLLMRSKTLNKVANSNDGIIPLPLDANQLVKTILKVTKSKRKTTVWEVVSAGNGSYAEMSSLS